MKMELKKHLLMTNTLMKLLKYPRARAKTTTTITPSNSGTPGRSRPGVATGEG